MFLLRLNQSQEKVADHHMPLNRFNLECHTHESSGVTEFDGLLSYLEV